MVDDDQTCELKVQDVVLPTNCADNLVKATKFLDDLLVRMYDQKPYYNVEEPKDLIGHLGMGIAPHFGAIVCRIIGFADVKATMDIHSSMPPSEEIVMGILMLFSSYLMES